jgi:CheY-like chemotaxis protein
MEAVGRMAGGIAHDFKNLLAGMLGLCQVAVSQARERTDLAQAIGMIQDAAHRGVEMVEELLAISRSRPLEPIPIDLAARLRSSEVMYRRLLGADITAVFVVPDEPVRVMADPGQLDRLVLNLLVNARDAIVGHGQVVVELETATSIRLHQAGFLGLAPGEYALLRVRDTGQGMDAETRQRIFEPFFTTKPEGEGTGLGLAMVYASLRQLGGAIDVDSTPGEGTTFQVALPRYVGVAEPRQVRLGSGTVLVVDDDELVRLAAEHELAALGYTPWVAASGEEALAVLEEHPEAVDAVLTDVRMPAMSGHQLARRVADAWPDLPVVLMSAQPLERLVREGRVPPDQVVLEKPLSAVALSHRLHEVLGSDAGCA